MKPAIEEVVLVDRDDVAIGRSEKIAAHRTPGLLHRAFSVVLFDGGGRLLLQRRARGKYHFGGRWANSCCGHPRPGESISKAAERRVREELGLSVELRPVHRFEYRAIDTATGLIEHEVDHVMRGDCRDAEIAPDPAEVEDWMWIDLAGLSRWVARAPDDFTPWFAPVIDRIWGVSA